MSLQVISRGSHQQIVNGKNIVNKHYGVSLDTNRNKSKQVQAIVVDNKKQYKFQDSLEHFLRKMSSNKSSLFDLLEKEREHAASTMHIEPRQPKKAKKIKGTMGFRRAKKARRSRKA
jgi:hypothetical protein